MSQSIFTTVNGTPVHGVITHYDPYDITVEITQPFTRFTAGCHIPYFARSHKHYKGEEGMKKATELLTGLYRDLVAVNSKKAHLQSEIRKPTGLLDNIRAIQEEQTTLRQQKSSLKKHFKEQAISQKSYQSQLKALKDRDFELRMVIDNAKTDFFDKHLSGLGGFVSTEQLFDFLAE
ncbi:hypothetical protein [Endozoicomonas lisbonensis]|uniref:Uncharacterized protein n=1 Tax=Endozoicomonas lisbonensis TaxID=3120522 RepID=A0ABV2SQ15_9GAMM